MPTCPCKRAAEAMKEFRAHIQTAPLGVLFAWFTGVYFIGTYGFALLDGTGRLTLVTALIRFVTAALFGGAMTAVVARQRRRDGGVETTAQITTALKTGSVPKGADASLWVPALEGRRRQNERAQWMNPIVFGVFTALSVWLAVQDPTAVVPWIFVAFFVAIAVFSIVAAKRLVRKIDALLAQVDSTPVTHNSALDSGEIRG